MRTLVFIVLLLSAALHASTAVGDVFAFTDEDGVTYFSNVPSDDRYKRVLDGNDGDSQSMLNPRMLKQSASFNQIIESAADQSDVSANLLRAVIVVESGFDELAESPKGAQGLMQLMPQTARHYGVDDALDPEQNIHGGARYLRDLIDRYENDLELVLAAFNAGETGSTVQGDASIRAKSAEDLQKSDRPRCTLLIFPDYVI